VYEFCASGNLRDLLRKQRVMAERPRPFTLCNYFHDILDAMEFLHSLKLHPSELSAYVMPFILHCI
jgi:hypothetical protein